MRLDTRVNYTVVGLFVVILGAAMVVATFWLSEINTQRYHDYLIFMDEAVSGLSVDSPVKFNGVQVGSVSKISLNPKNPQQVELLLRIEQGTPITQTTVASLLPQGITGISYVSLKAKTADAPLLIIEPGQQYPVIQAAPSLLLQLDTVLKNVMDTMQSISDTMHSAFDEENRKAIKQSLLNLESITQTLADNSQQIDLSIKSANLMLHNGVLLSQQLPGVLTSVEQMSNQITGTSRRANAVLNDSQAAVQTFSQQALPSAVELINRLNQLTTNLQQISNQVSSNPSVLIRGRAPELPGPGEK